MKKTIYGILLLVLGISVKAQNNHSFFIDQDWEKARDLAKESNKILIVDFYTEWCGWCKVMDKNTFSDSTVLAALNKDFVGLKLDAEKGIGVDVAMKYGVSGYPTIGYFYPSGKPIAIWSGYCEPAVFLQNLDSIKSRAISGIDFYPGVSSNLNLDFPDFFLKANGKNGKRKYPDEKTLTKWLSKNDVMNEVGFRVFQRFSFLLNDSMQNLFTSLMPEYNKQFATEEVYSVGRDLIFMQLNKATSANDTALFNEILHKAPLYCEPGKSEDLKADLRFQYYQDTKDYAHLVPMVEERFGEQSEGERYLLNNIAWELVENCSDKALLERAAKWMAKVIVAEPKYNYIDTYAWLLYKTNKLELAKEVAERAINVAKNEGKNAAETEKLLELLKQ
ncbi:MAG: thioredoxin family protein [Flavobacteriales bacterium]|nr:thioredoxin family protein [Flavobacteriales bacterium]